MSLRFLNIKSGEELVADSEPKIAALWGSSDRSPNANQGQDMGWRFAPEVVVEMREIMSDSSKIQEIANRFRKLYEDVGETDVMTWISMKTDPEDAPVASAEDYKDDYEAEIRRLEAQKKKRAEEAKAPTVTTQTTESLDDMERRVALQERMAKAQSVENPTKPSVKK